MTYALDHYRTDCFEITLATVESFEFMPDGWSNAHIHGYGFRIDLGCQLNQCTLMYKRTARISADDAVGLTKGVAYFMRDNTVADHAYLRDAIEKEKHTIALLEAFLAGVRTSLRGE